jgi:hypothetical protein
MKKFRSLCILILLCSSFMFGQTHVSPALDNANIFTNTNQFTLGLEAGPILFANLGSISTANTTLVYITDATLGSSPCTGSGTGALAIRINGAWNCNSGASGSGSGTVTSVGLTLPTGFTVTGSPVSTTGNLGLVMPSGWASGSLLVGAGASSVSNLAIGSNGTCLGVSASALAYISCGSSGGGNPTLDNCTPDQTGNSFYTVSAFTQLFYAAWQFIFNTTTYINCTVYVPNAQSGATIALDIATSDNTAGHTANFQECDEVVNSGTINPSGALSCAAAQTFTTTSTAYNRVTLTFNVQSTLSNGSILLVKIGTVPSGTAPTANMTVYPHFIL